VASPWEEIPECPLKVEIWQALKELVEGKAQAFLDEFNKACRMPRLIQEQDAGSRIQEQDSCGTASAPPSPAALPLLLESELQPEPAVIGLPCNDGSEFQITEAHVAEFQQLYPAVDVMQQLREMRAWLISNPKRKKTHGGMMSFFNTWLSKEQDKGPAQRAGSGSYTSQAPAPVSAAPKAAPVQLPADLNRTTGPKAWAVIVEQVRKRIDPHSFGCWIQPLKGLGVSKGTLYVNMPTSDFEEVVSEKWGEQINAAAEAIGLSKIKFVLGVGTWGV